MWRITLEQGYRFHDGNQLTASSFADAWDMMVAQDLSAARYLDRIEGWSAVTAGTADHLSGVTVIDDLALEVTLDRPFSSFPLLLGTTAYLPLPQDVLDDPYGHTERIIGNGPFEITQTDGATTRLRRVPDHHLTTSTPCWQRPAPARARRPWLTTAVPNS